MIRPFTPAIRGIVLLAGCAIALLPPVAQASGGIEFLDLTSSWNGITAIVIFVLAYALVISEETLHLRKSKPVMVAAGIIWALVALAYSAAGDTHTPELALRSNLVEFGELFLFLLAAMTYINTMDERGVFNALRVWLVTRGFSLRKIFWVTGLIAFLMSPIADNLTTALLMSTVVMAVGGDDKRFVSIACINIVVAANAGGAFSPFGDITTLMVWQAGLVEFGSFFTLLAPSIVNWLVPATIMSLSVSRESPPAINETATLEYGAFVVVGLFLFTIGLAISAHNFLHLPPVLGMMTGLGILKFYGYYLKRRGSFLASAENADLGDTALELEAPGGTASKDQQFDIFRKLERAEWDTLMFFYGIILCVGGLGAMGYLALSSELLYDDLGATTANILVGVISAIVDNIPVMFAVLEMLPEMSEGQWLLVTLTAGTGGSLLSIGSAAGVAVMGQARGVYTFFAHLKWIWAIALGYAAGIGVHLLVNAGRF